MRTPPLLHRRRRLVVLLFVLALGGLAAGGPPGSSAAAAEPELALIHILGERPLVGRVRGAGPKTIEILPAGATEARQVPLDGLIEIRFPDASETGLPPGRHRITLMDGSVLVGTLSDPTDAGFRFSVRAGGQVGLSFEALRVLELLPPDAGPCLDLTERYPAAADSDVVHLRRGDDQFTGTLEGADAEVLRFEDARGRVHRIPWTDVRVLHLDNDPLPAAKGLRAEIDLSDGSRLVTAAPPVLAKGALRFGLRTDPKAVFEIPLSRVRALRYLGGRFVYLSDLPFESTYTPFYPFDSELYKDIIERFGRARADRRGNDGCPLRIDGKVYRHGLGVHSRSLIRSTLAAGYTSFQVVFGIDDSALSTQAPDAANVDARVLGDGQVLWEKKGVTLEGGAERIGPLDVGGVKTLELIVDFGANGDTADRASWVNPILVRK